MRKFLNTLYVLNKDAYLSLEGENIVLLCNKAEMAGSRSTGWKASAIPAQALP